LRVDSNEKPINPLPPLKRDYDPADPFALWLAALKTAEPARIAFYEELDSLELHDLIMAAPVLWNEAEDSVKSLLEGSWQNEFGLSVDTSREVNIDYILDSIKKLKMNELMRAGMIVAPAAQVMAISFGENGYLGATGDITVEGVTGSVLYYQETEWGNFVIGGPDDNVYNGDFALIMDAGGDDVYRGRTGGAMGELGHPYSLVIDLSGDDYYDARGLDVAHGAGFLGIGILIDRAGDDVYRSGSYSQGVGYFGIGILADHGGADDRRGGHFMQGAGHCGVGILLDEGDETSDDRYLASCWSQGFASTFGYGLLFDDGGDDTYKAGGVFRHAPLLPNDHLSFSAGFGMGWRPRAGGGIGVLYDNGDGNDFYEQEVMSIGSSYWYSIGILIEGGGNDSYNLAQYGMGSGIHLSLGAMYDISGDDQYHSRNGVVGATPHDLSVGIMVDGAGDDFYTVSDGWGASLTNSYGLFIDRLGNDTYATRGKGYSFGKPRWARGFAGAAIFLDLEGTDVYPGTEAARDSSIWIRSGWGIGIDLARDVPTEKEEPIGDIILTAEDSLKSVEDLYEGASAWEVGSARESVKRARTALFTKIDEALVYVIENKLDTKSSLEMRLLDQIVKEVPDSAGVLLVAKLPEAADDPNPLMLGNTVRLLGSIKAKSAVEPLLKLLKRKRNKISWNRIISTLGSIGETEAAGPISRFMDDPLERRRLAVLGALNKLKEPSTLHAVITGLDDELFTVRSSAVISAAAFGHQVIPDIAEFMNGDKVRYPENGLLVLGRIAKSLKDSTDIESAEVKYKVSLIMEGYLSNDDVQLRAAAVAELYRMGKDETRSMIRRRMEAEFSPVVLAAFERVVRDAK
jgi:HEAT repeat protein